MKKSIFLFFAAILCAIGMNAAVPSKLYLDASEWGYSDARYAAYFMPQNSFVDMTKATGEVSVFEVAVPASQTKVIFVRMNGATTENNWNNGTKWNQTGDLTIPTDGKNKFKPSGWDGATTTWSTYTYTPPTFYIAGDFVTPNWDPAAAANKMDYADGVFSKSYNGVAASAHQFKITDGDWSGAIGYNQNTCSGTNCTVEGNGENIQFTPLAEGTVTITYTIADGKVHITCPEPPAAEFNITYPATQTNYTLVAGLAKAQAGTEVSFTATPADGYVLNVTYNGNAITGNNNVYAFMMPAADVTIAIEAVAATTLYYVDHNSWGNANAYMWNDSGNNGWPGAAMALVGTVGDNAYSYYSISFAQGAYTSIIFNGGGTQTGDLTINTAKPYFYDGEWYTWDDLLAKLAAPVVTYDYYITGSFNGNNPKKAENGMTLDGALYKATVTLAEGDNTLKVTDGSWDNTWGYSNLGAAYDEVSDANDYNNIKITLAAEAEKEITVIFDATAGKITFANLTEKVIEYGVTFNVTVPEGTEACYICGEWDWSTFKPMTYVDDTHYTLTIDNATKDHKYKYTFGEAWAYVEKNADGSDVQDRTWTENDVVAAWANPLATNIYLAGSMTDWANGKIEFMKETPDATIATVAVELPVGDNTFKIMNGENWLGNGGNFDNSITGWSFTEGDGDCTLKATYAATYVFTWDLTKEDQQLSVTYPTVETLNYTSLPKTLVKTWRTAYTELDLGNYNTITIYNHDGTDFTYGENFEVIASLDEVNLEGTGSWKVSGDDEVLDATLYNEEKTAIYLITASTTAPKTYTLNCTDAQYAPTAYSTIFSGTADGKALMIDIQMMEVGLNEAFGSCSWDGIEITSTAATVSRDLLDNDKYNVSGVFNDAAGNTYNITITGAKPKPAATLNITGATFTEESWGGVVISGTWDTEALGGSLEGADFGTYGYAELYTDSHYLSSVGDVTFAQAGDGVSVVLTGKFSDMMDATPYDVTITGTLVEFVAPSIELTTSDNETTIETYAWEIVDATIKRTFEAEDGWYTLCVPFGMDASLIGEAYEITSINKNDKTQGIDVTFSDVDYLWAGYPYLIKPTTTVTDPVIEGVQIEYTSGEEYTVTGDGIKITMTGIINGGGTTNGTTEYYVGADGYLYNGTVNKLGLCALFTITDLAGNPTRVRARVVTGENATTGVDDIFTTDVPVKAIVNGQLIIIRGNEKFNAQGQKL